MTIEGIKFKVEYDYEDLNSSGFSSYERHIIWRYKYLGIGKEHLNKVEKEIIDRYLLGEKVVGRKETYETGIYIRNIKNIVDYDTEGYEETQNIEYMAQNNVHKTKNQIILSALDDEKEQENKNIIKKKTNNTNYHRNDSNMYQIYRH